MIDELLKNEVFLKYLPVVAGLVFIGAFLSLGFWQLDRAAEKTALLELFESGGGYAEPSSFAALEEFDRIEVAGRYRPDRQVLIENIPKDGRLGYYVITPFEPSTNDPLLLVNRGWVPKGQSIQDLPDLDVSSEYGAVRGLVGHLPRVAIRPGEAFAEHGDWPRSGLYPTEDEVATEIGEKVLPMTLLLAPDAANGFLRDWRPNVSGPTTHYSYAFQWFAMALAVAGLLFWHTRKRRQA